MEAFLGQSLLWLVLNQFGYKICNISNFAESLVLGLLLIEPTRLGLLKSESDSNIVFIAVFVLFFLMLDEGSWPKVAAKYFKFTTSL